MSDGGETTLATRDFLWKGLSDPKQFAAMTPITATVVYVCIALGVVLIVLVVLWAVSACCEQKRPKRRLVYRSALPSASNGGCDHHAYGSTACLSTATTTSFGNDSECQLTGNKLYASQTLKPSGSPVGTDFSSLGRETKPCHGDYNLVYSSTRCRRCEKRLRSLRKAESKRQRALRRPLKRHSSEKSKLLRNASLYYNSEPRPRKELRRAASQSNGVKHYHRHYPIPSPSHLRHDYFNDSLDERFFPRLHMIPRAKLDSAVLEKAGTVSTASYPNVHLASQGGTGSVHSSVGGAPSTSNNSVAGTSGGIATVSGPKLDAAVPPIPPPPAKVPTL